MIGPAGKYRGRASAARDNKPQGEIGDNGLPPPGCLDDIPGQRKTSAAALHARGGACSGRKEKNGDLATERH